MKHKTTEIRKAIESGDYSAADDIAVKMAEDYTKQILDFVDISRPINSDELPSTIAALYIV